MAALPDENEVKAWLNDNDEKDNEGNGILAKVIGKYPSFKRIAILYGKAELAKRFNLEQHGHLVAALVEKLNEYWKFGI